MSRSRNEQLIEWMAKAAMFGDCAVLGVASVLFTSRLITLYFTDSSALTRIKHAPEVRVSDLKTLISEDERGIDGMLVVVKGTVEAMANLDAAVKISVPAVLVSQQTGDVGVVLQRTKMCKYYEATGFWRLAWGLRYFFSSSLSEAKITTQRKVPFALVDTELWPQSKAAYILVNLDGSDQQLPVDTIFHQIHTLRATPFAFIQALFGYEYPVAVIEEEKMLLIGKEVYAAGICSSKDGVLEIRSSENLSYFLSDTNKREMNQMIATLTRKNRHLFWATILVGTISVGILSYSLYRNWNRWKQWRSRRIQPTNNTTNNTQNEATARQRTQRIMDRYFNNDDTFADGGEAEEERDNHDIPVGESCIICLVRSREYAFVPCGHQVCCHRCANKVQKQNEMFSQCPVCRQVTIGFLRIYRS